MTHQPSMWQKSKFAGRVKEAIDIQGKLHTTFALLCKRKKLFYVILAL